MKAVRLKDMLTPSEQEHVQKEFEKVVRPALAKAWDQGYAAAGWPDYVVGPTNPYKEPEEEN